MKDPVSPPIVTVKFPTTSGVSTYEIFLVVMVAAKKSFLFKRFTT